MNEPRIRSIGEQLLSQTSGKSALSLQGWSQSLLDRMMAHESFRVAALRFTDVAPTLRNDKEFMDHLGAYFGEVGGLKSFIGDGIPGSGLLGRVMAPLVRKNIKSMAHTFIAGETLDDGIATFRKLHDKNIACSIDLLGEAVVSASEAAAFTEAYRQALQRIAQAAASWPAPTYPEHDATGPVARANVSVKLSALYEHVDPAAHSHSVSELCTRLGELLAIAMQHNAYIHIDTEQFELVPITLEVFEHTLLDERFKNYPHVGIVCQAYLRESEALLEHLIALGKKRGTPFSIRLVKGAYWDYEQAMAEQRDWPSPVFANKAETDINYEKLTRTLIQAFPHIRPCIGSHNARSLAVAIACAEEARLQKADIEFQMLYGMADTFRDALRDMGYRVRQYCPVGEFIPGMSYLVRRLLENTANQSFLRMHSKREADTAQLLQAPTFTPPAGVTGAEVRTKARAVTLVRDFSNHPLLDFSEARNRIKAEEAIQRHKTRFPVTVRPLVNGKTVSSGEQLSHTCPWQTETTTTHITCAGKKDVDAAIAAAQQAWQGWHGLGAEKRAAILNKAADIAAERWDVLFALQIFEAGKDWKHTDADIAEGIDFMRYYAQEMPQLAARFQPNSRWGEENTTLYAPRGITAVIAPWNFPFAISAGMTSAALAAGNPVLYKPAEQTSATAQALAECYRAAGVPEGIFHFLPGKGEEIGAYMVSHPQVACIAFTGSRDVGLHIVQEAAKPQPGQHFVKKCIIEMGGKNALIIDSDADLDEAVPATVKSAFGFQGQKCSACSRVIVVGSAYEPFVERIKEMVVGLRVGSPDNPIHDVNAVIDAEAQAKIEGYIKQGKKDGTLLVQASAPAGGHYVAPSVFTDLKAGSKITTEEIFGPVLAVYKAESIEQAVAIALDNEYALTGGLFSRNPKSIAYAKQHFTVGNLYINRGITGALVGRQPFGGGALSGTGTKAGGPDYLLHFVEPRVITENTMRRGFAPALDTQA